MNKLAIEKIFEDLYFEELGELVNMSLDLALELKLCASSAISLQREEYYDLRRVTIMTCQSFNYVTQEDD